MSKKISSKDISSSWGEDRAREQAWLRKLVDGEGEIDTAQAKLPYHDAPWTDNVHHIKSKPYVKCAHTHPPLKIEVAGKDSCYTVYGGAASDPVHANLDIYVALDHGTAHDKLAYPWHGTRQFIYFPISDMSVPKDPVEFRAMIDWLADQVMGGKSVHVGCIGGHGRTGMVLAALASVLGGHTDAITYVRDRYCKKAVETTEQANWLTKHFGIKKVAGAKQGYHGGSGWGDLVPAAHGTSMIHTAKVTTKDERAAKLLVEKGSFVQEVKPMKLAGNLWGVEA